MDARNLSGPGLNPERYEPSAVGGALIEARGLVSVAARQLGCHPATVRRYVERYAEVRAALTEAREGMRDTAEGALYTQVESGDMSAIRYYLGTQARDRGYGERVEQVHSGTVAVDHVSQLSDAELRSKIEEARAREALSVEQDGTPVAKALPSP